MQSKMSLRQAEKYLGLEDSNWFNEQSEVKSSPNANIKKR